MICIVEQSVTEIECLVFSIEKSSQIFRTITVQKVNLSRGPTLFAVSSQTVRCQII